jgi:hypothetical protein
MALIPVLHAFEMFAEVWDRDVHEQLAPALRQHCKELADLINGRRSKTLSPAPRKGSRPPTVREVQEGLRAAAAMHFLVPTLGKDAASRRAARLVFGKIDAGTIDYWRDQGMNGVPEYRVIFDEICRTWTAKITDPEQRAKSLIKAHRKSPARLTN